MTFLVEHSEGQPLSKYVCRLCTQGDQTLWNIFETCDSDGTSLDLAEKIIACLDIMVEINDRLPDLICGKCMTVIRCFFDFRQQCKEYDSMFRECLLTTEEPLSPQGETVIPDSLPVSPKREGGTISERKSSLSESEARWNRRESQHKAAAAATNEPVASEKMLDTSLVNQLHDEWNEADSNHEMHNRNQFELPWRLSEEGSFKPEDEDSSLSHLKTSVNLSDSVKDHDIVDNYWSPNPVENFSENCNEDPLLIIAERKETAVATSSDSSHGDFIVPDNAGSDLAPLGVETTDKKSQNENVPQVTNEESSSVEEEYTKVQVPIETIEQYSKVLNEGSVVSEIFAGRVMQDKFGKWICDICNMVYVTLGALKAHIGLHYRGPNQCPECLRKFDNEEALAIHKNQHINSTLTLGHSCQYCYKSFRRKHLLDKHVAGEHLSSSIRKTIPKKFRETCGKCIRVFYSSLEMENHDESCGENSIEPEEEPLEAPSTQKAHPKKQMKFECPSCTLLFFRFRQLVFHSKKVHNTVPNLKCEHFGCEREFPTTIQMCDHQRKVHAFKYTCDYCKKQFREKNKLEQHMVVHTREKRCKCDICGKSFGTALLLYNHKARTYFKRFKCETCGKECGHSTELRIHMDTHTNIKRSVCEICGCKFKQKAYLQSHIRNKHMKKE